jgi:hypothetical protein
MTTETEDLRSRLACVAEATYWDRPYDERIAAIRGMCDLTTDGMTPAYAVPEDPESYAGMAARARIDRAYHEGLRDAARIARANAQGEHEAPAGIVAHYIERVADGQEP